MRFISVALFVAMVLFVSELSGTAHAYLDPGTGSMALQLILGGIVGGLTLMKLYWRRVKAFVLRRQKDDNSPFAE
jgi:hypothetical protein